jgi:REP element-mobilizing transposase RayT
MSPNARWHIADDAIYHIVTRGNNRMTVFRTEDDFQVYVDAVDRYRKLSEVCNSPTSQETSIRVEKGAFGPK